MSRFMRYGAISGGPLLADKIPDVITHVPDLRGPTLKGPVASTKKVPRKLTAKAPDVIAGAGPMSGKAKNPLKALISGKPTEKDVREYLKARVSDLMGDSSSDED